MKRETLILKAVVLLIGLVVLGLCLFVLPVGIRAEDATGYRPIIAGLYIPAVPFFVALHRTLKLLGLIDGHQAFSDAAVNTLKTIRNCALAISGLFAAGMPYIFYVADKDDAPGVVAIGLVVVFASIVISVFAAVLQKLLENAKAIKSENDLTV